jgi:hypothetical protein
MFQKNRVGMIVERIRLSSREIAVAIALTVAAAAFLVTAMSGGHVGDGSPVAAFEQFPDNM